jgi:hypothetical protein
MLRTVAITRKIDFGEIGRKNFRPQKNDIITSVWEICYCSLYLMGSLLKSTNAILEVNLIY